MVLVDARSQNFEISFMFLEVYSIIYLFIVSDLKFKSKRNLVNLRLTAGAGLIVLLRIIYWLVSAELYKIWGGFGLFWMFHVLVCNMMILWWWFSKPLKLWKSCKEIKGERKCQKKNLNHCSINFKQVKLKTNKQVNCMCHRNFLQRLPTNRWD